MFGIYKKIAGKILHPKKQKMKKIKLSPSQKARLKGFGKKALDVVQSGKAQSVIGQATRFSQGKAVIIKNPNAKPGVTKTVSLFGYQVPQNYVIGGVAVIAGGALLLSRRRH